jgi:hypothetical protein
VYVLINYMIPQEDNLRIYILASEFVALEKKVLDLITSFHCLVSSADSERYNDIRIKLHTFVGSVELSSAHC